jgi:hypothetical protein
MNANQPLLSRMAGLFAARAGLYSASALIAGVFGITALSAVAQLEFRGTVDGRLDSVTAWHSMTFANQLTFIFGLLFGLWAPVLVAARGACRITMAQITGQPLSLGTVLADMFRFVPSALVYSLLIGLPIALGTAMIFFPGILAASFFALVIPTSVGEAAGIFTTLRRGVSLGERVFGRLFLFTMASAAIMFMVVALRVYGLDQFLPGSGLPMFATRFGVTYVPALFVLLLANISFTLLYLEARGEEAPDPAPPISSGAVG